MEDKVESQGLVAVARIFLSTKDTAPLRFSAVMTPALMSRQQTTENGAIEFQPGACWWIVHLSCIRTVLLRRRKEAGKKKYLPSPVHNPGAANRLIKRDGAMGEPPWLSR